ncbi:MAG: hypothetical protein WBW53_24070 [Terriglobales bacterium]
MIEEKISDRRLLEDESEPRSPSSPETTTPKSADLLRTAADPTLSEDLAQALLKRADLPAEVLEQLAKNAAALKSRKVKIALVSHPHTPRHVSVPLARQFHTFDLMKVALSATVPADIKLAVDDVLIARLQTVTIGERLTLARRGSGRVAAALLSDVKNAESKIDRKAEYSGAVAPEIRVMQTALENRRLTEALVIRCVLRPAARVALVHAVAQHPKWSRRKEIRAALLRTEHLSLARALEFAGETPAQLLQEVLSSSRLPAKIKDQLLPKRSANS